METMTGRRGVDDGIERDTAVFFGLPDQVRQARGFVAGALGRSPLADDGVLIADELMANAVRHTASGAPGGRVTIDVARGPGWVYVAVTDQGGAAAPRVLRDPVADPLAGYDEGGRGLLTVESLARCWGWHDAPSGRTVYAVLFE